MKKQIVVALLALIPVVLSGQQPPRVPADLAGGEWLVEGAGRAGDVKIDTFLGRRSLWLRNSTQAIKSGARLIDGTIEFDVAPMAHGDFVAIVFRRQSLQNHENIYLRPRSSGEFMAIQYAPRMNGSSTWQLYPEFTARTEFRTYETLLCFENTVARRSRSPRTRGNSSSMSTCVTRCRSPPRR